MEIFSNGDFLKNSSSDSFYFVLTNFDQKYVLNWIMDPVVKWKKKRMFLNYIVIKITK